MTITDPTRRPAADPSRLTGRLRAILVVVLIADVLDLMDSTITNIAAPTIVRNIGGGQSLIKWLGASYALALGVLLIVGGRLGDRYGRPGTRSRSHTSQSTGWAPGCSAPPCSA